MEDFKSKIDGAKRLDKKINNVKGIYIVHMKIDLLDANLFIFDDATRICV